MEQINSILNGLKINGQCINHNQHRHLATYDIQLEPGTMVSRIERRTREIALGIRSVTPPIVKLMPKSGLIRLHVAMDQAAPLPLSGLFGDNIPEGQLLPVVLGETDEGQRLWVDLSEHPHTLVAGATGSGKSVFLRTVLANLAHLKSTGARDIEVYLVDPKVVEFNSYEKLNKLIASVAYTYDKTLSMLKILRQKMEARYKAMAQYGIQSIKEMPYLFPQTVVIIDEVADLMLQDKKSHEFETGIVKLAQKARAAGIYLVLATQRPSKDVLTGLIKANFPARISCKVSSRVDSQVVLDSPGAESLLGRGDAILQSPIYDRVRFQAAFCEPEYVIEKYNA